MIQRIIMIILILVIVLGGGMYAYKELMPPVVQEAQATVYATKEVIKGNISVGVETIGRLDPSNHGGLRVPGTRNDGTQYFIDEFLVEEGDEVKQGQLIVKLSSSDIETKIEDKQEELKNKRKQLSEICQVPVEEIDNISSSRGITITSSIDGVVTELDISEGSKLELGSMIARIVDNSKFIIEAKLFEREIEKIKEGQKVVLTFSYFSGQYEGVVTKINPNRIPYNEDDGFPRGFVYNVTIEAENIGLIQRDMDVRVGVLGKSDEYNLVIDNFSNLAKVDRFIKEDKVMNTSVEAVVTDIHVDDMQEIKKGDPIITMSGIDVQDVLQEKIDEIHKLKSEINELSSQMQQMEIKAPMDGIVAGFNRNVGESVSLGEWIGSLYTVSEMMIWTEVDDIDVLNVNQGAPVSVTVDALPNASFEGAVENVSTMGEQVNGISKFGVSIKVKGSKELRPGMQAKAYIDAGSADNVLLVPLEAIFEEEGKTMVEILLDNNMTKVIPVKLGLMNDRVAEVKEGLKEGDKVVTGSSADLLPSQHIKSQGGILPDTENSTNEQDSTK